MGRIVHTALAALVVFVGFASSGAAAEPTTFERMIPHYEKIRVALLHDGFDDVADAARHIGHLSQALEDDFSERVAGTSAEDANELRRLLPSIRDASERLANAGTLSEARESFGQLSEALVQYRQLVTDPVPAVAFCSMARKVWLQPSGEIGNPYYGQSMARCGEFVSQ